MQNSRRNSETVCQTYELIRLTGTVAPCCGGARSICTKYAMGFDQQKSANRLPGWNQNSCLPQYECITIFHG